MTRARNQSILIVLLALFALSGVAQAGTITFTPTPANMYNLDHNYAYIWGIDGGWSVPGGQQIKSATLSISNIWNWDNNSNILYVDLLSSVSSSYSGAYHGSTTSYWDNEGGGDYFSSHDLRLGTWTDPDGGHSDGHNISFSVPQAQFSWLSDGNFGFGFDPDCHFYNDGMKFEIETGSIPQAPEPASLMLLGSGLVGLGTMIRRRKRQ